MSYFGFLGVFLCIPIALLWWVARRDAQRGIRMPAALTTWAPWTIVAAHAVIAVVWTTPWDNYLVATRVWWYDPNLVTGILIGYVPIEEYTFFVLQPLLTGGWLLLLARHMPMTSAPSTHPRGLRWASVAFLVIVWVVFAGMLVVGWRPGTYMALLFIWAIPPLIIQAAFGADILWRHRKLILMGIIPMTLYLAAADKLAIATGTWTINPEQSVNIFILGRLPLEELLFFFMTNVLIVMGITLVTSAESKVRATRYVQIVRDWLSRRNLSQASKPTVTSYQQHKDTV